MRANGGIRMIRLAALLVVAASVLRAQHFMEVTKGDDFSDCGGHLKFIAFVPQGSIPDAGNAEVRIRLVGGPAGLVTGGKVPYVLRSGIFTAELPVTRFLEVHFEPTILIPRGGAATVEIRTHGRYTLESDSSAACPHPRVLPVTPIEVAELPHGMRQAMMHIHASTTQTSLVRIEDETRAEWGRIAVDSHDKLAQVTIPASVRQLVLYEEPGDRQLQYFDLPPAPPAPIDKALIFQIWLIAVAIVGGARLRLGAYSSSVEKRLNRAAAAAIATGFTNGRTLLMGLDQKCGSAEELVKRIAGAAAEASRTSTRISALENQYGGVELALVSLSASLPGRQGAKDSISAIRDLGGKARACLEPIEAAAEAAARGPNQDLEALAKRVSGLADRFELEKRTREVLIRREDEALGAVAGTVPQEDSREDARKTVRQATRVFFEKHGTSWNHQAWLEFLNGVRPTVSEKQLSDAEVGQLLEAEGAAERQRRHSQATPAPPTASGPKEGVKPDTSGSSGNALHEGWDVSGIVWPAKPLAPATIASSGEPGPKSNTAEIAAAIPPSILASSSEPDPGLTPAKALAAALNPFARVMSKAAGDPIFSRSAWKLPPLVAPDITKPKPLLPPSAPPTLMGEALTAALRPVDGGSRASGLERLPNRWWDSALTKAAQQSGSRDYETRLLSALRYLEQSISRHEAGATVRFVRLHTAPQGRWKVGEVSIRHGTSLEDGIPLEGNQVHQILVCVEDRGAGDILGFVPLGDLRVNKRDQLRELIEAPRGSMKVKRIVRPARLKHAEGSDYAIKERLLAEFEEVKHP